MIKRKPSRSAETRSGHAFAFSLDSISIERFGLRPNLAEPAEEIGIFSQVRFGINPEEKGIACGFDYRMEVRNTPTIFLDVVCVFLFATESWSQLHLNGRLILSKGFAQELAMITSGVSRGILHAKTENTVYNNHPIPLFTPNYLVREDIRLQ